MRHKIQLASLSFIICLLSFSTAFTSCSEDAVPAGISPSSEFFKILGDTVFLYSETTDTTFSISADCGWTVAIGERNGWEDLHVTPDHGEGNGIVTITTSANDKPVERKSQLTISTFKGISKTKTIVQKKGNIKLEIALADSVPFGLEGGSMDIVVESNTEWTVSGGADWCKADKTGGTGNGTFVITAEENKSLGMRHAVFLVDTGIGKTVNVNVYQSNKDIELSTSTDVLEFNSMATIEGEAQIKDMIVFCNDFWTASVSEDWVRLDTWSGGADGKTMSTVRVFCDNNTTRADRTAKIIVHSNGLRDTVVVRQSNEVFEISPTHLNFSVVAGETKEFTVRSNDRWEFLSVSDDWLEISPRQGGSADRSVVSETLVTVKSKTENTTGKERTATISLRCGESTKTIDVTQRLTNSYLNIDAAELLTFGYSGGQSVVNVSCNTAWQVFGETDWCQLRTNGGGGNGSAVSGDGTVVITAQPDAYEIPRMATISFFAKDTDPVYFTVIQGDYNILNVSPLALNFEANGGNGEVYINVNGQWTARTASPWLQLSASQGNGPASVTVQCTANSATVARNGTIEIEAEGQNAIVNIFQQAAEPPVEPPVVNGLSVSSILNQQATLTASYSSTAEITAAGFVYATHAAPEVGVDPEVACTVAGLTGTMTATLTGLDLRQTYYVRAYATNAGGTAYSSESSFEAQGRQPIQEDNATPSPTRRK